MLRRYAKKRSEGKTDVGAGLGDLVGPGQMLSMNKSASGEPVRSVA